MGRWTQRTYVFLLALSCACCPLGTSRLRTARAFLADPAEHADDSEAPLDERERAPQPAATPVNLGDLELPSGREIAQLTPHDCQGLLDRAEVGFEIVPEDAAPNVYAPIYMLTPINGVTVKPRGGPSEHALVDCRLAVALLAWSPILREAGVTEVEHYSSYRAGAKVRRSRKPSGHARALALDAARFHLEDGRVLDVEEHWEERERGGAPCPEREDEGHDGTLLRHLVCEAVSRDLFQVVITPHHDRAHENHVHLELVPEVDWSYVR